MSGEVLSHELPLDAAIAITKSYAIENFELWAQNCPTTAAHAHPRLYSNRDIGEARRLLSAAGLHVACVAFGGAFHPEIVQDRALYIRELVLAIEIAHDLGAEMVNHYCNHIAPGFELNFPVLEQYFARPLRRAEELGVTLVLENEAHDVSYRPENVREIVHHFNSPYFRTNFDVANYYQASCEAFPHAYDVVKDAIGYVHIKNGRIAAPDQASDWLGGEMSGSNAGRRILYTPPTEGAVNIIGLLDRLTQDEYDGYIALEPHSSVANVLAYYQEAIPLLRSMGYFLPGQ